MKKRRSKIPTFTCSICLAKRQAIAVAPAAGSDDKDPPELVDEDGNPVFQVSACGHRYCAPCMRDFVCHQLLDGHVDIPCCYFNPRVHEDYLSCCAPITEADVSRLVRMDLPGRKSEAGAGDGGGGGVGDLDALLAKYADGAALWAKYQKLKFDKLHGKDAVRRCPKCDEPRLFDARSMKEYRFKLLSQNNDVCTPAPAKSTRNTSTGYMSRLERVLNAFRDQRNTAGNPVASDEAVGSSDTNPREGEADDKRRIWPKVDGPSNPNHEEVGGDIEKGTSLEKDGESSEGQNLTQPLPIEPHSSPGGRDNSGSDIRTGVMGNSTFNAAEQRKLSLDISCNAADGASGGKSVEESKTPETNDDDSTGESMEEGMMAETGDSAQGVAGESPSNTQDGVTGGKSAEEGKMPESADALARGSGQAPSLVKSTTPTVICHACNTEFCYFHSNAHSGKSCVEYHLRSAKLERSSVEYASDVLRAKPCPECGIPVDKEGGCNLMRCHACGADFCWLCGRAVDNEYEHYRWWNAGGCANMITDHEQDQSWCEMWLMKLMWVLRVIVLGPPTVALSLASMLLCPCLASRRGDTFRERLVNNISFWGNSLGYLLEFPLMMLEMLLTVLLRLGACFVNILGVWFAKMLRAPPERGEKSRPQPAQNGTSAELAAEGGKDPAREVEMGNLGHAAATSSEDLVREWESISDRV